MRRIDIGSIWSPYDSDRNVKVISVSNYGDDTTSVRYEYTDTDECGSTVRGELSETEFRKNFCNVSNPAAFPGSKDLHPGCVWFINYDMNKKITIVDVSGDRVIFRWLPYDGTNSCISKEKFLTTFTPWKEIYDQIPIGSIWKSAMAQTIKVIGFCGDAVDWINVNTGEAGVTHAGSFRYEFNKFASDDNGIVYVADDNTKVKVQNTRGTSAGLKVGVFIISSVEYTVLDSTLEVALSAKTEKGVYFHSKYHVYHPETPESIDDNEKSEESCIDDAIGLKTDTSKLEDFGSGAVREDKTGKGRYDLIPGDIMRDFETYAWTEFFRYGNCSFSDSDVSLSAYFDEWDDPESYYYFIMSVTCYFFTELPDIEICVDDFGEQSYDVSWHAFRKALYKMRNALAKHYENGAKIHGVDNWKKGLPVYGSERGGCFLDSMRRHIDQALQGKTDEPHAIAAIWNAFGAVWTLVHKPHSAMFLNASAVKGEEKSTPIDSDKLTPDINILRAIGDDLKRADIHEVMNEKIDKIMRDDKK